jgi:hypothetical protein
MKLQSTSDQEGIKGLTFSNVIKMQISCLSFICPVFSAVCFRGLIDGLRQQGPAR